MTVSSPGGPLNYATDGKGNCFVAILLQITTVS